MPPPDNYIRILSVVALAGTGTEREQKIAIILVLFFARLQLRLQLCCVRTECIEYSYDFLLYFDGWHGDQKL